MTTVAPLLDVHGVEAAYGPFRALFGVSFSVRPGSAVALLGANGSGKSTVARVVTGLVPATAGAVVFDGTDVTRLAPWRLARLGVAHAPEGRSVFSSLSVEENLALAFRRSVGKSAASAALDRAYTAFPLLRDRRRQQAGTLSGGEQRMLSLARVLADPPKLLVVDELSLGLAPVVVDEVFATLRAIRDAGTALLIVEQHVGRALSLADEAVLLQKGRVLHQGATSELGDLVTQLLPSAP